MGSGPWTAAGNQRSVSLLFDAEGAGRSPSRIAFQETARPERNRFRVRRTPCEVISTVYDSPSISISRRMGFSSFVVIT